MIHITIRRRIPSQNAYSNKHFKFGKSAYAKERDHWHALLRAAVRPKEPPTHKVNMVIKSYRNRLVDDANLRGGAKAIPDCLIKLGYLKDDSVKWFFSDYEQHQVKRVDERTEIILLNP